MAGRRRGRDRPRLAVVRGDGSIRTAAVSRRGSPATVAGLPALIYFPRGSSTPTRSSLTVLRRYADWLACRRARKLWVVGHANRSNRGKASRALAAARVRAVRDLLVWLGAGPGQVRRLSPSRLHADRPAATAAERAAHRSVELIVGPTGQLNVVTPVSRSRASARRRAA